jgi:hypothetical protein
VRILFFVIDVIMEVHLHFFGRKEKWFLLATHLELQFIRSFS